MNTSTVAVLLLCALFATSSAEDDWLRRTEHAHASSQQADDGSGSAVASAMVMIEEWTIVGLFGGFGVALLLLALGMLACGTHEQRGGHDVDTRNHALGAVNALLGQSETQERQQLDRTDFRIKLTNTFIYNIGTGNLENRTAELRSVEFFEQTVTDTWLLRKLGKVGELEFKQVGWKTLWRSHIHVDTQQEDRYVGMRNDLRKYIRDELFIRGQLEPFYSKPAAMKLRRLFGSAISLFDFGSDVAACLKMVAQIQLYGEHAIAVSAVICLTLSSVISSVGVCFFLLTAEGETQEELKKQTEKYFCVIAPALTNPEMLVHIPWHDRKAVRECNGLPSVQCALFCAIASVLEDVPQVILQLLYVQRTTGFSQASDLSSLPWQLQVSLAMSLLSLVFRVGLRFFIGVLHCLCNGHTMDLHLKFSPPQTHWEAGYVDSLIDSNRFQPANEPSLRARRVQFCWLYPGEQLVSTTSPDAEPWVPCPHGGFVYLNRDRSAFSFACNGTTCDKSDKRRKAAFPTELGPLPVHGVKLPQLDLSMDNDRWQLPLSQVASTEQVEAEPDEPDEHSGSDVVGGLLSPVALLKLSKADQHRARIPPNATHLCWAYPSEESTRLAEELRVDRTRHGDLDIESPEFIFLSLGGFIYFEETKTGPPLPALASTSQPPDLEEGIPAGGATQEEFEPVLVAPVPAEVDGNDVGESEKTVVGINALGHTDVDYGGDFEVEVKLKSKSTLEEATLERTSSGSRIKLERTSSGSRIKVKYIAAYAGMTLSHFCEAVAERFGIDVADLSLEVKSKKLLLHERGSWNLGQCGILEGGKVEAKDFPEPPPETLAEVAQLLGMEADTLLRASMEHLVLAMNTERMSGDDRTALLKTVKEARSSHMQDLSEGVEFEQLSEALYHFHEWKAEPSYGAMKEKQELLQKQHLYEIKQGISAIDFNNRHIKQRAIAEIKQSISRARGEFSVLREVPNEEFSVWPPAFEEWTLQVDDAAGTMTMRNANHEEAVSELLACRVFDMNKEPEPEPEPASEPAHAFWLATKTSIRGAISTQRYADSQTAMAAWKAASGTDYHAHFEQTPSDVAGQSPQLTTLKMYGFETAGGVMVELSTSVRQEIKCNAMHAEGWLEPGSAFDDGNTLKHHQVFVPGRGEGIVTGFKKCTGGPSEHTVEFGADANATGTQQIKLRRKDNGEARWLYKPPIVAPPKLHAFRVELKQPDTQGNRSYTLVVDKVPADDVEAATASLHKMIGRPSICRVKGCDRTVAPPQKLVASALGRSDVRRFDTCCRSCVQLGCDTHGKDCGAAHEEDEQAKGHAGAEPDPELLEEGVPPRLTEQQPAEDIIMIPRSLHHGKQRLRLKIDPDDARMVQAMENSQTEPKAAPALQPLEPEPEPEPEPELYASYTLAPESSPTTRKKAEFYQNGLMSQQKRGDLYSQDESVKKAQRTSVPTRSSVAPSTDELEARAKLQAWTAEQLQELLGAAAPHAASKDELVQDVLHLMTHGTTLCSVTYRASMTLEPELEPEPEMEDA